MTKLLHIHQGIKKINEMESEFKALIQSGLSQPNKQIQSKFFYDEEGCKLFNQITRHPDYYLTNCELEILQTYKKDIAAIVHSIPFNLVELGPGEGVKTKVLIEQFLKDHLQFSYLPIDISMDYLKQLASEFEKQIPRLNISLIHSDYLHGLEWLSKHSNRHNFVLFLGSSIGNFNPSSMIDFLTHLKHALNEGDFVLIGFDLRKDIDILMRAYNDSSGITRDFNLNLLQRINRELYANFDINKFRHYATYNVYTGAMESYLVSVESQVINVKSIDQSFHFESIEPIHVEYSYKYLLSQLNEFAEETGFEIVQYYFDSKEYFVDALWRVKEN